MQLSWCFQQCYQLLKKLRALLFMQNSQFWPILTKMTNFCRKWKKWKLATLIWKVLIVVPFCNLREERIWQRTKVSLIRLLRIWPLSFDPREVHVNKTVGFIMHSKNIIWNLIPPRAYIIKRTKYQNDDSHLRIFPWEFICKWCLKLSNLYLWKICHTSIDVY